MTYEPVDIEKMVAQTEEQLDALIADSVGDPRKMLIINAARAIQVPTLRFMFTELNADTDAQDIAQAIAGSFGASLAQLGTLFKRGDRQDMFMGLMSTIEQSFNHSLRAAEQEQDDIMSGKIVPPEGETMMAVASMLSVKRK